MEIYWKSKIVGVLPSGTFFHFYAEPGSQLIGAHLGANSGSTNVTLKSGEVYYLKQDFSLVGVTTLEVVAAEEGRAAVSTLKLHSSCFLQKTEQGIFGVNSRAPPQAACRCTGMLNVCHGSEPDHLNYVCSRPRVCNNEKEIKRSP